MPPARRASESASARAPRRRRRAPQRRARSDVGARILVAIPAAILAVVFVDLGGLPWALFLIVFGCLGMLELYGMLARWRTVPFIGMATLVALVLAARYGGRGDVLEVAMAAFPVLFLAVLARGGRGSATVAMAGTLLGIWWIGLAFAHAELLRGLPHGGAITIDLMLGTFLGDTAAYVGGRLFGRHQLAPSISPGKTTEGLFCGMLIAILAVFLAGLFQNTWMTQSHALLLGLAVALLGPLGDLFESMLKRDAGTKDAGSLFGAHGGVLDRADALIFTMVGGYYVWLAIVH